MLLGLLRERATKIPLECLTRAKRRAQIHLVIAEEARAEATICGKAHTVARAAIRVRHRRDHTDRAWRTREMIVRRRTIAARRTTARFQRTDRGRPIQHLVARHAVLRRALAQASSRHELDEADVPRRLERQAC